MIIITLMFTILAFLFGAIAEYLKSKYKMKMNVLDIELKNKIDELERFREELSKRPFKLKSVDMDFINPKQHPELTNQIIQDLNNGMRGFVTVFIDTHLVELIIIGRSDSHNANFGDDEEGEIFVGVVNKLPKIEGLKFNDLIEFQSCDVYNYWIYQ